MLVQYPIFLHIYNILRLSVEEPPNILYHGIQEPLAAFYRSPGHVGGDDTLTGAQQGIARLHRLLRYHIHCGIA